MKTDIELQIALENRYVNAGAMAIDGYNNIDEVINSLQRAKERGATHVHFDATRPREWPSDWIRYYRERSEVEIRQDVIKKLQDQIDELNKPIQE